MPNCFQLINKATGQPTPFNKIDDDLRQELGFDSDPVKYLVGWYDFIGFMIAVGKALGSEELRKEVNDLCNSDDTLAKILAILERDYTSNAWVEIGRRDR